MNNIRVGQVNSLGEGKLYGGVYGNGYDLLKNAGFDCTDVGGLSGETEAERDAKAKRERDEIMRRGLVPICYHSIFLKPWASVDENIRLQEPHMQCARGQGARLFLVHAVWDNFKCYDLSSAGARDRQFKFDVRTLGALARRTADFGLRLVVENNPLFPPDYYLDIIENLPAELCGAILDTGHANLQPAGFAMPTPEIIARLGSRLEHLHLNDNDGIDDQHLPVLCTYGTMDWNSIFRALRQIRYQGVLNEELPPITGIAWTAWSLLKRKAQPLRDLWDRCCNR